MMFDFVPPRDVLPPVAQKELYENFDVVAGYPLTRDTVAEMLFQLTGIVPGEGTFSYDPDLQSGARKVAIRWLKDHGFLPR